MSEKKVVHIPADLHRQLRIKAANDNTSIRALIVAAVEKLLTSQPGS